MDVEQVTEGQLLLKYYSTEPNPGNERGLRPERIAVSVIRED